jgi:hypothetical protein
MLGKLAHLLLAARDQIYVMRSLKQQPAVKLKNLRSRTQFKKPTKAQKFGYCV